jgi:hypothetical protein
MRITVAHALQLGSACLSLVLLHARLGWFRPEPSTPRKEPNVADGIGTVLRHLPLRYATC